MQPDVTPEVGRAVVRALNDPEIRKALDELGNLTTLFSLLSGESDEDVAFRKLRRYALSEASRSRAKAKDVAAREFTREERFLLGLHEAGRELLEQMTGGDDSVVQAAKQLLNQIEEERAALGME